MQRDLGDVAEIVRVRVQRGGDAHIDRAIEREGRELAVQPRGVREGLVLRGHLPADVRRHLDRTVAFDSTLVLRPEPRAFDEQGLTPLVPLGRAPPPGYKSGLIVAEGHPRPNSRLHVGVAVLSGLLGNVQGKVHREDELGLVVAAYHPATTATHRCGPALPALPAGLRRICFQVGIERFPCPVSFQVGHDRFHVCPHRVGADVVEPDMRLPDLCAVDVRANLVAVDSQHHVHPAVCREATRARVVERPVERCAVRLVIDQDRAQDVATKRAGLPAIGAAKEHVDVGVRGEIIRDFDGAIPVNWRVGFRADLVV